MPRRSTYGFLLLLAACEARIAGAPREPGADVDAGADPSDAAGSGDAGMIAPWSTPAPVSVAATTTAIEDDVTLSSDTLEMFFAIDTGNAGKDLYYTARSSPTGTWTKPILLAFNSATQSDETPRLSADDRTLYYASGRAGNGTLDIYSVTRAVAGGTTWSAPSRLAGINTTTLTEKWYMPCGTNHYVMVQTQTATLADLVEGTVGSASTPIGELNSAQNETGTFVTSDCLTIYFASNRSGTSMLYTSSRASLTAKFAPPTVVTDFMIPGGNGNEEDPWMSPDGRTFAFASDAAGTKDVYLSTR